MWEKMAVGTQLLLSRNSLPVTSASACCCWPAQAVFPKLWPGWIGPRKSTQWQRRIIIQIPWSTEQPPLNTAFYTRFELGCVTLHNPTAISNHRPATGGFSMAIGAAEIIVPAHSCQYRATHTLCSGS